MKQLLFIILMFLYSANVQAYPDVETFYLNVDGLERYYNVYVPEHYNENRNYPVVFVLHGGGGKARGMLNFTKRRFNELAERDGFIVAYPNGFEKGWNDGDRDTLAVARQLNIDDVGFFDAMIDDLDKRLSINRKNICACGISNGGFMVQRLAIERSRKFKAIGVVAANMSEDQQKMGPPDVPVPVIFICGTTDPLVPFAGGPVTVLKQKRGEVLSNTETVKYWKKINGCTQKSEVYTFPDINITDNCWAVKTVWQNADNPKLKVVEIRVEDGGHTWPGTIQYLPRSIVGNLNRDFNGCDEIWEFFKSTMKG
ncbi:MAG: alpha/beta hydrolase family esterase [Draconibacterium sp.]